MYTLIIVVNLMSGVAIGRTEFESEQACIAAMVQAGQEVVEKYGNARVICFGEY